MKLNRIKLLNWRNHIDTTIKLDRLTVFRGANKQGKSGIAQAIEFALTGRCDATDAGGKGMADLIRQGSDTGAVLAELQSKETYEVLCKVTSKPERTLTFTNHANMADRGEIPKKWIEERRAALSCLLNARYFMKLEPKDQKSLLASIILRERYDWPEAIKAKCNAVHLSSSIPWDKVPFDVIEAGYKAAFEKRTEINRDLKNQTIPEPIAVPEGAGSLEELRVQLEDLHRQADALALDRTNAAKARSKAEGDIRVLQTRIESYEAKIRQEQQVLETIETLTPKQVKDLEKTASNGKKVAEIEASLTRIRGEIAGISALLAQFDALDGKNECPTCSRAVTDEFLTGAMQPHIEKKNALDGQVLDLLKEQKSLGDVAGAQRKLDQVKTDESRAKRSKAICAETDALLKTSRHELDTLESRLPSAPADASEEEAGLRSRIVTIEGTIGQVAVADQRAREIIKAQETRLKLQQAQATLEALVAYFGKDGVKAQLLAEDIGPFTSAMNEALAGWGYAVAFEIEPYGFRVSDLTKGTTLGLNVLSGSERLRFSVAFQVALAQVSGIRMVIVDEADILDAEGRSAFYELLLSADIDQAIAIGMNESREVPDVEGVVFYMIENGNAERLVPQEVSA